MLLAIVIGMKLTRGEMASAVSAMSEEDDGGVVLLWMKDQIG